MRLFYLLTVITFLFCSRALAVTDSIGVKTVKNKTYVIHKVEKGEGLFSIARKYKVSVKDLQKANPGSDKGLDVGQKLLIPRNSKSAETKPATDNKAQKTEIKATEPDKKPKTDDTNKSADDKKPIYHTVTKGESLSKIAVNHHMTVAELKNMNNGLKKGLKAGSKIIVGYNNASPDKKADESKGTKTSSSKKASANAGDSKYKTTKYGDKIDQKLYNEAEKVKKNLEENKKEGNTVTKEVNETGMGSSIDDGSVVAKKNMALHRTAPPNTVIKVTNPMNGKFVFVTVVAPLPKETTDPNCIIKITKTAANALGILDSSFRVELHYTTEVVK